MILVLGWARSHRAPNLGCRGAKFPGWFNVSPKISASLRCDACAGMLSWWSSQSPVAHSCGRMNHPNSFHGAMFKLNTKFDTHSLLYLLSHFECGGHMVHIVTQWHQLPPLTSTVKLSLFTQVHFSPLSLAARLHRCCENHSCYINNSCTFSR